EVDADAAADDVSADAGAEAAPDAGSGDETLDAGSCLFPTGLIPDGSVTSTTQDPDMTLEKFTLLCDQRGGTVYLICHCGGANTCKGLSYDFTTQTLIEHTC